MISGIWEALDHLGVEAGAQVLEPSMGVGHFFGLMPEALAPGARRTGVELDSLTARIAQRLYPDATIFAKGFEETPLPDNFFDAVVGNIPFGNYPVFDPTYRSSPAVTRAIHDYFFAKSLDKARAGGVVALITSRYTMDKQDATIRQYLAERANLIGAIRLPNTAFKANAGTEVTTDILFLQKHGPGVPASGEAWRELGQSVTGATEMTNECLYQSGFGNEFATEAVPGALPVGQNAPQEHPLGLYTEQFSGTPFTAPRAVNRRTWTYRIRPSVTHRPYEEFPVGLIRSGPFNEVPTTPNQLRWDPLPMPEKETDFLDGIITLAGNGDPAMQTGVAIHLYAANASMRDRFFANADGELLIVPQMGTLRLATELGIIDAAPGEICVIPRGVKFRVELLDRQARGYICENYGLSFRLPELGPIGANGLANPRDFQTPVAAFEDRDGEFHIITKFLGRLWSAFIDHSPLDVVAWHGNYAPYKYDMALFNCINTVSFDHPDPSIYTVLSAPSAVPGTANCDFAIFPPRWMVAEHSLPPSMVPSQFDE